MRDAGFLDHCLELLAPLGRTSARRMFGGHALYVDGLCLALILRDVFYLKVDDTHRAAFEQAGGRPFTYTGKGDALHTLSYYTPPEAAMESPAEMQAWGRRALAAAIAARGRKQARKTAPKKTAARPRRTGARGSQP